MLIFLSKSITSSTILALEYCDQERVSSVPKLSVMGFIKTGQFDSVVTIPFDRKKKPGSKIQSYVFKVGSNQTNEFK